MGKKLTREKFIEKAKKVHGDKFDYSLVEYKTDKIKVKIICLIHGIFEQSPNVHYNHGCPDCANDSRKDTTENFIKKSKEIHGDKFDYSLVDYKNIRIKIKLICPTHGIFEQSPESNLKGNGCMKCSGNEKLTTKLFIEKSKKIHGDKFDYSLINYIDAITKVKIICPIHGIFEQRANSHYAHGCNKCECEIRGKKRRLKQDDLIKDFIKMHVDRFDYSKVNYINKRTKIEVICKKHGSFFQRPLDHRNGNGCSKCYMSKGEIEIGRILKNNNIKHKCQKKFVDCVDKHQLPFDFYLKKYNLCVEYDGEQHFKPVEIFGGIEGFEIRKKHDNIKDKYCEDNHIELLRIRFDENINEKLKETLNI